MLGRRDRQRWWKLDQEINEVERQEVADHDVLRVWIEARTTREIRPLLYLRPDAVPQHGGPPCEACGRRLESGQHLAACTVCLTVFHQGCLDRPGACAFVACQEVSL